MPAELSLTPILVLPEIAHQIGLLPLLWFLGLRIMGVPLSWEWWWITVAFTISWIADWMAHWIDPGIVSLVYPIAQIGLLGAVLLPRSDANTFTAILVGTGILAVLVRDGRFDLLLRTVSWGWLTAIVWTRPAFRPRSALLVTFGLGLIFWWTYTMVPGWPTYGLYQSNRLLGIGLLCWAQST